MRVIEPIRMLAVALSTGVLIAGCSEDRYDCEMAGEVAQMTALATAWTPSATGTGAPRPVAAIDDGNASAMIKSAVLAEPGLAAVQIDVDVEHSIITLDGFVDTPVMKVRAAQIAQSAGGANFLVDNVVVRPPRSGWRFAGAARSAAAAAVESGPTE